MSRRKVRYRKVTKLLISWLRGKPYTRRELMNMLRRKFPEVRSDALSHALMRCLEKLVEWELVNRRDGYYSWYIYIDEFKSRELYEAKLHHSRRLIPGLRLVAGLSRTRRYSVVGEEVEYLTPWEAERLRQCALDHLRCYPELWKLYEEHERLDEIAEKTRSKLIRSIEGRLRGEFKGEHIVDPGKVSRLRRFVGSNVPSLVVSRILYGSPREPRPEGDELWFGAYLVAKGPPELHERIEAFIEVEEKSNIKAAEEVRRAEREALEARGRLQLAVEALIHRVESGEPLLGRCGRCPKVFEKGGKIYVSPV
ncbi:MAG: hypothetical protein ACTSUS_04590 [Candidatus Freyarchaeota archaeon]